jgi:hypothetical protein
MKRTTVDAPGEDGYFDEYVAATFDDDHDHQAEHEVVGPMVDVWEKPR